MDRRSAVIAGMATAFALTSAGRAQTPPAKTIGMNAYVPQTLLVGGICLEAAQMAAAKASDDNVKRFAALEIAEQQTVAGILASVPGTADQPDRQPAQQEKLDRLAALQPGREFDLAFVEEQIAFHDDLLQIQRLASGGRDATVEAITARIAEQAITSHMVMLGLIQQMLTSQEIQNIQEGKNPDGSVEPQGDQIR